MSVPVPFTLAGTLLFLLYQLVLARPFIKKDSCDDSAIYKSLAGTVKTNVRYMVYVKCTAKSLAWENVVIISLKIPRVLFEVHACGVLLSKSKFPITVLNSSAPPCGNVVLSGVFSPLCSQYEHSLNTVQKFLFSSLLGLHCKQ